MTFHDDTFMGDFDSSGSIHGPPAATMQIIRASMALGVVTFAAVATQVRKLPPEPPIGIGYAAAAGAFTMLALIAFFRGRMGTLETRAQRCTNSIIGWALGESAGFLGVISFFLGNPPIWTLPGLVVLAVALVAFPVPEDEPGR